jgi:hypothetical protein
MLTQLKQFYYFYETEVVNLKRKGLDTDLEIHTTIKDTDRVDLRITEIDWCILPETIFYFVLRNYYFDNRWA